ncbi:hypothetical protein DFH09DRAFT_419136 [Mycena vulgaris]|nr:hypothetical protein DFH09DRAFT_419136 [Mycena vulgaris]
MMTRGHRPGRRCGRIARRWCTGCGCSCGCTAKVMYSMHSQFVFAFPTASTSSGKYINIDSFSFQSILQTPRFLVASSSVPFHSIAHKINVRAPTSPFYGTAVEKRPFARNGRAYPSVHGSTGGGRRTDAVRRTRNGRFNGWKTRWLGLG